MLRLGWAKGYTLVCHTGNMVFVANEHADKAGIDSLFIKQPEKLFLTDWIKE
jgi:hypothetical protein